MYTNKNENKKIVISVSIVLAKCSDSPQTRQPQLDF